VKQLTLCFWLLILSSPSFGQDYIEYHRTFHRIDENILTPNYPLAIDRLDSIYANYDFIYAKHCIKALQICITANDSIRADKWLAKSFQQGIPLWMIRTNEITSKSLAWSTTQNTLDNFDSLHSLYIASIDTSLSRKIDSLLTIDQRYTRKVNDGFVLFRFSIYWLQWGINNQRQLQILKQIIETYGYPEERLIGLPHIQDSVAFAKHFTFWGPSELRDATVQIMLQHCYSTWHKVDVDFRNTLYENLRKGNMPAFQYALIAHIMTPDKPKYIHDKYWVRDDFCAENCHEIIDRNRYSVGLNTLEQEKRNTLIDRERRGNKRGNAEIMLE
jgi:hypothetical protein